MIESTPYGHEITTRLVFHTTSGTAMNGTLAFDVADPLAICLAASDRDRVVTWDIGRDVFLNAFRWLNAGAGDISMWVWRGQFQVHLKSPDGEIFLYCDSDAVREFLDRVATACPPFMEQAAITAALSGWLAENDLSTADAEEPIR